ncbi:MAG: hypothetical protein ACOX1F_03900 [Erysipelotrichaceae bacterium]|jgi:preprotein translocase subunit SecD
MRRNNKNLFSAIIGILLITVLSAVFGSKLNSIINKNFDLGKGSQLVYQVDSTEQLEIELVAEVLEKRLYNFGATEVKVIVEDSKVILNYSGIEDNDTVRKYLTMTGLVSFRNAMDEKLMDISVLNDDTPFMAGKSKTSNEGDTEGSLLYILVKDTEKFKTVTTQLMFDTNKFLVIWVDYDETRQFEKEKDSIVPAYLAAAMVNNVIDSDAYISSAHSFEETKNIVATINAGALRAPITETDFNVLEANLGVNADVKILWGIAAVIVLSSLFFILRYKLSGFVSSIMILAYTVSSLVAVSYLGVIFDVGLIALYVVSLFLGLSYLLHVNETFVKVLNTGRLPSTALETTYTNTLVNALASLAIQLVAGFIGYVAFKQYYSSYAIAIMCFTICFGIFFVGWQKVMLTDIIKSNYFEVSAFGCKENVIERKPSFNGLLNTRFHYVVIALILTGTLLYITNVIDYIRLLLIGLFILTVTIVIGGLYLRNRNKNNDLMIFVVAAAVIAASVMASGMLFNKVSEAETGLVYGFTSMGLGLIAFILSQLKDDYNENTRGKLSDVKVIGVFEEVFNSIITKLLTVFIMNCISATVVFGSVFSFTNIGYTILIDVVVVYAVIITCKLWLDYTLKNISRPTPKKKRRTKEVKERTVFGINNPN